MVAAPIQDQRHTKVLLVGRGSESVLRVYGNG
jgi:hypothetical protein